MMEVMQAPSSSNLAHANGDRDSDGAADLSDDGIVFGFGMVCVSPGTPPPLSLSLSLSLSLGYCFHDALVVHGALPVVVMHSQHARTWSCVLCI